jgi:hypothetical protein
MSAANGSAVPGDASEITAKGKGKAVDPVPAQDVSMDEDDSSEEESANEEPVSSASYCSISLLLTTLSPTAQ